VQGDKCMTATRGSGYRNGLDEQTNTDSTAIAPLAQASPGERLEYIAAMLQELQIMSEQANCEALAGLLGRAHREAERRSRRCR
jgi:hypothetical protein